MNQKPRIFSGIQPSGNFHIGNYLGAIANWVELQNEYDSIFCVVDLHAITVPQDPETLRKKTIEVAKIYLASGIDPEKSTIFIQSHVQEHTELAWILNTITRMSELFRMTQFKDKTKGRVIEKYKLNGEEINRKVVPREKHADIGLFDYPVLMAADILLYDTELVPVGEDQTQHVELARTLAKRFNNRFGETFKVPEYFVKKEGQRIMGLDNPDKKMSKSASSPYNYISLTDSEEDVRRKIAKAVTDSGKDIIYSDEKPALKNLINIYHLLSNTPIREIQSKYEDKGYADFKKDLSGVVINFLKPFQEKLNSLSDEKALEILQTGAEKVRTLAKKKLEEVKKKVGLR